MYKECRLMLKKLFGSCLGRGDYGHLLIDHAAMLFRTFLSFVDYTQQASMPDMGIDHKP